MKSSMQTARVLLASLALLGMCGCAPAEPPATPAAKDTVRDEQVARDHEELERRRLQLEKQVLADLRTLRERRQASTGAAAGGDDDEADANDCELLVFGGATHEVFLGCLTDQQRTDSVFNMIGEHGSEASPVSMRNKFGPYGSNHDDTSACNDKATHPPVVLSSDGKSLGMLTTNAWLKRRITVASVSDWLGRMCGY